MDDIEYLENIIETQQCPAQLIPLKNKRLQDILMASIMVKPNIEEKQSKDQEDQEKNQSDGSKKTEQDKPKPNVNSKQSTPGGNGNVLDDIKKFGQGGKKLNTNTIDPSTIKVKITKVSTPAPTCQSNGEPKYDKQWLKNTFILLKGETERFDFNNM